MPERQDPVQQERLARLILPFADRVEWIELPPQATEEKYRYPPSAEDQALVGATWDSAVESVSRSYSDALRLREELTARMEVLSTARRDTAIDQAFMFVLRELQDRQDEHGAETVVAESPPPHAPFGSFQAPGWTVSYHGTGRSDDTGEFDLKPLYGYHLPDWLENELKGFAGGALPRRVMEALHVDGNTTWGRALQLAQTYAKSWDRERRHRQKLPQTLKFRLSVLRNVIWQYEIYGLLRYWEDLPASQREGQADPDQDDLMKREIERQLDVLQSRLRTPRKLPKGHAHKVTNGPIVAELMKLAPSLFGGHGGDGLREVQRRYHKQTSVELPRDAAYRLNRSTD